MVGDEAVDPIPQQEKALSRLRQDVIDGDIDREHDLEALQVALSALVRGYSIFRQPYAHRLDLDASELDRRVQKIVQGWLTSMASAKLIKVSPHRLMLSLVRQRSWVATDKNPGPASRY